MDATVILAAVAEVLPHRTNLVPSGNTSSILGSASGFDESQQRGTQLGSIVSLATGDIADDPSFCLNVRLSSGVVAFVIGTEVIFPAVCFDGNLELWNCEVDAS